MSIKEKMRPAFQKLEGGLFGDVGKADVGDSVARMERDGVAIMAWADPFLPDPSIPPHVMRRAIEALESGFPAHYTMPIGDPELKRAIAKRVKQVNGLEVDPLRNILINPGSDVGLMFAMMPFINPGDEVMVHDPSYPSNFLNPQLLGGVTVKVPTYEENGYRLEIEEYQKRLTPRTKMVLLSSPNNPTTTVYRREDLEALSSFIIENDLICVCDQAFEDTVFPGHEMVTMAALPGMWERTLTVCSTSKGMGLSGFRVGYTLADDVIMDAMYGCAVNVQGATSTLSQMAVLEAFRDNSFIKEYQKKYELRRIFAYDLFNSIPGVHMLMPESGFYSWVNVSALGDSSEIVTDLINQAKVSCNDGSFYGDQGAGHIRIIHGAFWEDEKTFAALRRVASYLSTRAERLGIQ